MGKGMDKIKDLQEEGLCWLVVNVGVRDTIKLPIGEWAIIPLKEAKEIWKNKDSVAEQFPEI